MTLTAAGDNASRSTKNTRFFVGFGWPFARAKCVRVTAFLVRTFGHHRCIFRGACPRKIRKIILYDASRSTKNTRFFVGFGWPFARAKCVRVTAFLVRTFGHHRCIFRGACPRKIRKIILYDASRSTKNTSLKVSGILAGIGKRQGTTCNAGNEKFCQAFSKAEKGRI